jgi:hypothetical protein
MSRVVKTVALTVAAVACAASVRPAKADVEISPFAGYYIASDLYNSTGSKVELTNDVLYGGRITFNMSRQGALEFAYTRTGSDARIQTLQPGQPRQDIGRVDFDSYDINFLGYQYAASPRVTPFGLIGFGWSVTHPKIDSDFTNNSLPNQPKSNTLFNFSFGLGTKIEMSPKLGLRLEGKWRITDTAVTTSSGIWCDPWGYCYSYASDWYDSGEFSGGLTYKFGGGY